ncbi:hypothetical protein [Chryseobacterium sp. SIMBA_028]|uniref:hypothetical protein n=1 Tax=Chryseobacterium sp. SIMBA_028 TaxID=3085771 RepID=UPI00397AF21D
MKKTIIVTLLVMIETVQAIIANIVNLELNYNPRKVTGKERKMTNNFFYPFEKRTPENVCFYDFSGSEPFNVTGISPNQKSILQIPQLNLEFCFAVVSNIMKLQCRQMDQLFTVVSINTNYCTGRNFGDGQRANHTITMYNYNNW